MKKIISLCLALILIFFCLTVTGFAAKEADLPTSSAEINLTEAAEKDEDFEKISTILTEVVTYIYNYATQPEEPAVDLDTVLKIVTVMVKIVYTLYKQQIGTVSAQA